MPKVNEECYHYWVRRRDGRECFYCYKREYGPTTSNIKDEHGVILTSKRIADPDDEC